MADHFVNMYSFLIFFLLLGKSLSELCKNATCEYHWGIRYDQTMIYRDPATGKAYNLGFRGKDLVIDPELNSFHQARPGADPDPMLGTVVDPDDVISADGVTKNAITINFQHPGPAIEVYKGTRVIIHVVNNLVLETTSIHWHGLFMTNTPWMDGTSYVSMCPILPKEYFVYDFIADPVGTHYYHAHMKNQKQDGLYGMFIVYERDTEPEPYHPFVLADWFHHDAGTVHVLLPNVRSEDHRGTGEVYMQDDVSNFSPDNFQITSVKYESGLINGKGRFNGNQAPLTIFNMPKGRSKRFSLANAGSDYYFKVSVDSHKITMVASDGRDLEPITVDYFIVNPGETMDFYVNTANPTGRHWVRAKLLHAGYGPNPPLTGDGHKEEVLAILAYDESRKQIEPTTFEQTCTETNRCLVFNCPFTTFGVQYYTDCININQVKGVHSPARYSSEFGLDDKDYIELNMNLRFTKGMSINGKSFILPKGHFYDKSSYITKCAECDPTAPTCLCTQIAQIPANKTIQVVFSSLYIPGADVEVPLNNHHPVHMHGHDFAVLKVGFPPMDNYTGYFTGSTPDLTCNDENCNKPTWTNPEKKEEGFNLVNPAIKNDVIVPSFGYTVVRFRSNNPGYWYVHCHNDKHNAEGMAFVFEEAVESIPSPPPDFPTCHGFDSTTKKQEETIKELPSLLKSPQANINVLLTTENEPIMMQSDMEIDDTFGGPVLGISVCIAFIVGALVTVIISTLVNNQRQKNKL